MKYLLGSAVMASALVASASASVESAPMVEQALTFLARASSTSEVLTLNLTNLLILLGLKVLVIAFGFFSLGSTARSLEEDTPTVSQADLTGGMCFMMFTSGDYEKLSCVQRTACEEPSTAKQYLTAGKMWYNMHKVFKLVPFSGKYEEIMGSVEDAVAHAANGGDCAVYQW